jgi:putative RecB family exonuclease
VGSPSLFRMQVAPPTLPVAPPETSTTADAGADTGTDTDTATGAAALPTRSPSLSPSRASDFMTCPLLYRFRVIDKLPEAPSRAAVRGTVVHSVLERLFDLPALERTPERAAQMLGPAWEELRETEPELAQMFAPGADAGAGGAGDSGDSGDLASADDNLAAWLEQCQSLLRRYFTLEDPRRLEPAEREVYVETLLESGLQLRGYIDRLDVAPTGEVRIVDYKTGKAPGEHFEAKALFQMKFYALVLWRTRGVVPRMLQLFYLGSGEVLRYHPEERELRATERKVEALWKAIKRAGETGEWRANRSALCGWCDHQALCPAWGGTPPPLPTHDPAAAVERDVARTGLHDPGA